MWVVPPPVPVEVRPSRRMALAMRWLDAAAAW